jgi:hypothetical protein
MELYGEITKEEFVDNREPSHALKEHQTHAVFQKSPLVHKEK